MHEEVLRTALIIARAGERSGCFSSSEWPDLAVELLVHGAEDLEIAELAGLPSNANRWDMDPLVTSLYERHDIPEPTGEDAVTEIAAVLAAEFRSRPPEVSAPMVRALARLAIPDFESALASQCFSAEEYLDCDCRHTQVDPAWIEELDVLPGPQVPDSLVAIFARRLRATLPTTKPPCSH